MLGTRTKQINAYGKRSRRIVDASSDATHSVNTEIISIFDDMPPPPVRTSVASKMKKRENVDPAKSKPSLAKVVGLQRKRRLSPALSPIKKAQLKGTQSRASKATAPPLKASGSRQHPINISASPPRAPLFTYPQNIPRSPAISQKRRDKPRIPSSKGTPLRLNKPFSPFVDVDIIVLDEEGSVVRKERRVSRTTTAPKSKDQPQKGQKDAPISVNTEDSDREQTGQPRRPKRQVARKKPIIISDDSDSDKDITSLRSANTIRKDVRENNGADKSVTTVPSVSTSAAFEVLIPPAPYKIACIEHPSPPSHAPPSPPSNNYEHQIPLSTPIEHQLQAGGSQYHISISPSPILKPRRLTPIRGGNRKGFFEPPSPPSPTTPTDLDFSIDFSDLNLNSLSTTQNLEAPEHLKGLLEECHQETCGPHNFSGFIESFPFDPILLASRDRKDENMMFRKIGEASYSEVFGIGDVVLKVIPIRDEFAAMNRPEFQEDDDGPPPSDAKDVRKEIIVTRAMGEVHGGFVKLLKTYVVKGRYPEVLLQLWDEYNERKGSESVRPDTFKVSQIYAIIVLPNGGPDLEAYAFHNASRTGWRQAASLFWQVAKSFAHAERLVSFEHRDLHWGQILVIDLPMSNALKSLNTNQTSNHKGQRVFMDDKKHGVRATIIDLGLSRMDAGDGQNGERVHWTPFDEEVFLGEGDYQFEIYRTMKDLVADSWENFHPITNVLWLHYLLQKLVFCKGLKAPPAPRKTKGLPEIALAPSSNSAFAEKDCYDCLVDIENWLGQCIAEITPGKAKSTLKNKGRRKTQVPAKAASSGPACAGEIVAYGAKKGWIKSSIS